MNKNWIDEHAFLHKFFTKMVGRGWTFHVLVDEGQEGTDVEPTDVEHAMSVINSTDSTAVWMRDPRGMTLAMLYIVRGNGPDEVIADMSVSLSQEHDEVAAEIAVGE